MLCLLLTGGSLPAQLAPPTQVPFPAAVGIRPAPVEVGPVFNATSTVNPEDLVFADFYKNQIVVISGGYNNSPAIGTYTVVASSTVGSGTTFPPNDTNGVEGVSHCCVSPAKVLYYWDNASKGFVAIDLTQTTFPRTFTPLPSNKALVPGNVLLPTSNAMCWDFSTNTILYLDSGASTSKSTIAPGFYRYNPLTGTNTLVVNESFTTSGGQTAVVTGFCVTPDGTIYGFKYNNFETSTYFVRVNTNAANSFTTVDGGTSVYGTSPTSPRYYSVQGLNWDFVNGRILAYDDGDDQTTARILAINPTAGTRSFVTNGSAGPSATYDSSGILNFPGTGYVQTNGRLVFSDSLGSANPTDTYFATLAAGGHIATRVSATGTLGQINNTASFVPPGLPVITAPR